MITTETMCHKGAESAYPMIDCCAALRIIACREPSSGFEKNDETGIEQHLS